jgi:glycosyltransferase involved in cell wall biosynthesis
MRVAIDLLIAEKDPAGMLFATRALLAGLALIDRTNEYFIITSCPEDYQELVTTSNMHIHAVKLRSWRGILFQHQVLMPDILRRLQPDVLHAPTFAAPIGWHGPLVMTVHDLAFYKVPEQQSLYGRFYWKYFLHESVRRAHRIIAISEQTRNELITYWAIQPERIRIIHNALRPSIRYSNIPDNEIQEIQRRYGKRYLLHVGSIMPRKNIEILVQAFNLLVPRFSDLHLVLTGGTRWGSKEALQQIEASPYKEQIHLAGWVSDQDLGVFYAGASALVFPSKHEGFGLPIVEAMACGTPVVASPEAASLEIAGEAVVRADCSTAPPLSEAIAQVLTDEVLHDHLTALGKIQAQLFTIQACAEATRRTYEEAYNAYEALRVSAVSSTKEIATLDKISPRVSVIVPTTRSDQISQTLESISCQFYQGEIEIIVVGLCANELAQHWSIIPVNPGKVCAPGKARNLGALHANGDVLLFLDDDCTVAEDWVERNVLALQKASIGAIGARIRGKSRAFFARCTDFTNFGYNQHGYATDVPLAAASMGVTQAVFHSIGGFDETLRYGEDEDIDLCHRIQKQGYRTVYQPDILVTHDHHRDTLGKLLRFNYEHGLASGLKTKIRHRDIGFKNHLLYSVRFPPLFLLLLPFIAIAATARIVLMNVSENREVMLHAPFIFLAKLTYEFGVFRWLTLTKTKTESHASETLPTR